MAARSKFQTRLLERVQKLRGLAPAEQVTSLVHIALQESLEKAVRLGQYLDDPFVLRGFYVELVSIHYQELVEAGKLVPL